jgi:PAS domain S-box-containing protein
VIGRRSLTARILVTTALLIALIMAVVLTGVFLVIKAVSEDYQALIMEDRVTHVRAIIGGAVAELVTARLLDTEDVAEVLRRSTLEAMAQYWRENGLEGIVLAENGTVLLSTLPPERLDRSMDLVGREGPFAYYGRFAYVNGHVFSIPVWDWRVLMMTTPVGLFSRHVMVIMLIPLILGGTVTLLGGVLLVLRANVHRPVKRMADAIGRGERLEPAGADELDTIGDAINRSMEHLTRRSEQFRSLHDIALMVQAAGNRETVAATILERASTIVGASHAALGFLDERGELVKLLRHGRCLEEGQILAPCRSLYALIREGGKPVMLNRLGDQPTYLAILAGCCTPLSNILACPVTSSKGAHDLVLFLANKPDPFDEEDLRLVSAMAADAMTAAERILATRELARFKQVIDAAFDVVIITDGEKRILYTNPSFTSVTGHRFEEVRGQLLDSIASGGEDGGVPPEVWEKIRGGNYWTGELVNRKRDGGSYHVSATIFPIASGNGDPPLFATIQRDITQEKVLYEQLLRAQKMEAIGTLAGGIAHDFNNILTGVLGHAELMMMMVGEEDPLHKAAVTIQSTALKGAELAKRILTVTRKEKLETKPIDLNQVISSAMELLERSLPRSVEIVLNLKESLPPVMADRSQMQQVVMNLAVNAGDAMPQGGKLVMETEYVGEDRQAAREPGGYHGFVRLSCSDTGTGMSREVQRKVFDPFFTTKEAGKGTGLGLYIVHSIVTNHGGYINLYSEPGKGTRFSLYLPAGARQGVTDQMASPSIIHGSGTILVADDEEVVRGLCQSFLTTIGYQVLCAANGKEAVTLYQRHRDSIALVILDLVMPEMSGRDVFATLRSLDPGVKVLLTSGYTHEGQQGIAELMGQGAGGFLEKPFSLAALSQQVHQVISARA